TGNRTAIVVRRIVSGEGVERIFPIHSPRVRDIVVTRRGKVRRAKLYFLRDRVGKKTRVTELLGDKARAAKVLDAAARAEQAAAATTEKA
ncbi:MAG: large subunit ribosomal protein L19, partial [Bacteroidia bacterium]